VANSTSKPRRLKLYTEQSPAANRPPIEASRRLPTALPRNDQKHLAERLEAVLLAGAEIVGCNAAALYLLDDATTELRLRCSWGLPVDRPAATRPLQGALADLEALLGHAVVLRDDNLMSMWNVPEDFPAAVCVPVSSPTTILGTIWVFSSEKRDFNDRQTNILEVVAGRLALEVERETFLRPQADAMELRTQLAAAERLQRNELPTIAPLLDGWDLAGWTAQAGNVGGAFHDWFCLPDGLLAAAVGWASQPGVAGALTAGAVKTAIRSHARYHREAQRVLPQVNLTLWTGSAGDRRAEAFLGFIETATGRVSCASAGRPSVVLLRGDVPQSLCPRSIGLGEGPEADFVPFDYQLQSGDALVVFTDNFREANGGRGQPFGQTGLADAFQGEHDLSAADLLAVARTVLDDQAGAQVGDRSILVIKRTTA
jgi:serine phosphatase RsbU (regulator of sigma subunit)